MVRMLRELPCAELQCKQYVPLVLLVLVTEVWKRVVVQ